MTERERFEAWARGAFCKGKPMTWQEDDCVYLSLVVQRAWEAWQAAVTACQEEAHEEKIRIYRLNGDEETCGLCGLPGADKVPHPVHWPDEAIAVTDFVHAECEDAECARASALCQGDARDVFIRNCY